MSDTPSNPGADPVFGFEDLQALREEYEERIATMKQAHDEQSAARQELIQELTIELAGAREDAERRAADAEQRLAFVRNEIARVEGEVGRLRGSLDEALVVAKARAPALTMESPLPTGMPAGMFVDAPAGAPPPVPVDAGDVVSSSTTNPADAQPPSTSGPVPAAKKRRIRLR